MIQNGKTTFIFHRKDLVDNLLKKKPPECSDGPFAVCDFRFTVCECRKPQTANRKSYFLMKVFVTVPSSVVTRTKYMPLARPLTLIWMGE